MRCGRGRGILYEKPRSFEVANKGVFGFYGAVLFMTSFGCVWLRVSLVTMVTINWNLLENMSWKVCKIDKKITIQQAAYVV